MVDLASFKIDAQVKIDLADHVAISDLGQLLVSSGDDEYALQADGTLLPLRSFLLGINLFVLTFQGAPSQDDIEKIVFKP